MYLKFVNETGRSVGRLHQMVTVITMRSKDAFFLLYTFQNSDFGVVRTVCGKLMPKALRTVTEVLV